MELNERDVYTIEQIKDSKILDVIISDDAEITLILDDNYKLIFNGYSISGMSSLTMSFFKKTNSLHTIESSE